MGRAPRTRVAGVLANSFHHQPYLPPTSTAPIRFPTSYSNDAHAESNSTPSSELKTPLQFSLYKIGNNTNKNARICLSETPGGQNRVGAPPPPAPGPTRPPQLAARGRPSPRRPAEFQPPPPPRHSLFLRKRSSCSTAMAFTHSRAACSREYSVKAMATPSSSQAY